MTWELMEVTEDIPWVQDNSGIYAVIHRVTDKPEVKGYMTSERVRVRVDIMGLRPGYRSNEPLISFIGVDPDWVRKAIMEYLTHHRIDNRPFISQQHASYIGQEIQRAFTTPSYVQD